MKDPLTAGDICTRDVVVSDPSMEVVQAAQLMRQHHAGCVVVTEQPSAFDRVVVGILTDRDIAMGVVALDRTPHGMRVGDLMSREVVTAREDDSILDLLSAMRRKGVRRVPVTTPSGSLVGIVALDDVLEVLAQQMHAVATAVGAAQKHDRLAG